MRDFSSATGSTQVRGEAFRPDAAHESASGDGGCSGHLEYGPEADGTLHRQGGWLDAAEFAQRVSSRSIRINAGPRWAPPSLRVPILAHF
jgi:hypothetical protein